MPSMPDHTISDRHHHDDESVVLGSIRTKTPTSPLSSPSPAGPAAAAASPRRRPDTAPSWTGPAALASCCALE